VSPPGRPNGEYRSAKHEGAAVIAAVDHLVIAAADLAQGVRWCEQQLGVSPGPGGRHAFMGTHNRLLNIGSALFPQEYLEINAIDPDAPAPPRPRWFGLDQPALQQALRQRPRLLHVVARCARLDDTRAALGRLQLDTGPAIAAQRDTPDGVLRWRISLRDDGRLLCGGALPTLIEWQGNHPTERLPSSTLALTGLSLGGLPAGVAEALDLHAVQCLPDGPALCATLDTPRGSLSLRSDD
jgi:hypothetical protein